MIVRFLGQASKFSSKIANSISAVAKGVFSTQPASPQRNLQPTPQENLQRNTYPTSTFRFSVEKESYRGAEFAINPESVKIHVLDTVFDFFPEATVDAKIELSAFDNGFNTYHRKFFVVVAISDSLMSKTDFDENVTYLKQALKNR